MAGFICNINTNGSDKESSMCLRMPRMHFKLRHLNTGCYLFSHKVKLPKWGFNQQEVTYNKNAVKANSLYIRNIRSLYFLCGLGIRGIMYIILWTHNQIINSVVFISFLSDRGL
ncbi:hypothetical protein DFH29DRAFT_877232 [Suillus ampliporus]|nr:hypothetical protein DFH29DRAFT_877232 [Suillus ampliporus]